MKSQKPKPLNQNQTRSSKPSTSQSKAGSYKNNFNPQTQEVQKITLDVSGIMSASMKKSQSKKSEAQKRENSQAFNLETLLDNAKSKRNNVAQHMARNTQGPVLNKIDTFDGDNDHVEDEEEESSGDENPNKKNFKKATNKDLFGTPIMDSASTRRENSNQKQQPMMPSPFKETPLEQLKSKKEDFDNPYADELISDDEFIQQSLQSNQKVREILKDSSTRIINKGKEPIQLEINLMDNNQDIFNQNLLGGSTEMEKEHNYYPEESRDTLNFESVIQNQKTNSDVCNFESIPPRASQNSTKLDQLKEDYLNFKQQILDKYKKEEGDKPAKSQELQEPDEGEDLRKTQILQEEQHQSPEKSFTKPLEVFEVQTSEKKEKDSEILRYSDATTNYRPSQSNNEIEQILQTKNLVNREEKEQQFKTLDDFLKQSHSNKSILDKKIQQEQQEVRLDLKPQQQQTAINSLEQSKLETTPNKINQTFSSPKYNIDSQILKEKQSLKLQKKKQEVENLKKIARERELQRKQRHSAAVLIQKNFRGYYQRKNYWNQQGREIAQDFLKDIFLAKYAQDRYRIIQLISRMGKEVQNIRRNEEEEMMEKFMSHCALIIQTNYRGYYIRKFVIPYKRQMMAKRKYELQKQQAEFMRQQEQLRREQEKQKREQEELLWKQEQEHLKQQKKKDKKSLLLAVSQGWKLRQILKGCKETLQLKEKIKDLDQKLIKKAFNPQVKEELKEERFCEVAELIRVVNQFMNSSRWIFSYERPQQQTSQNQLGSISESAIQVQEDVTQEQLHWDMKSEEPALRQQQQNVPKKMPQFEDRPLTGRPILQIQQVTQSVEDEEVTPQTVQYDFEKMIEEKLANNADALPTGKAQVRSKTARQVDQKDKDPLEDGKSQKHQELLQKRKKYDPRQAAKEAKKQKNAKPLKSAFPQGLLSNKDPTEEPLTEVKRGKSQMRGRQKSEMNLQDNYNQNQVEEPEEEETKQRDTSNAPKPFLKRKTQKVNPGFQKLKWKGASRIDCWKKEEEGAAAEGRDQSRGPIQRAKSTRQANLNRSPTPNTRNGNSTNQNSAIRRTTQQKEQQREQRDKSASKQAAVNGMKSQRQERPPRAGTSHVKQNQQQQQQNSIEKQEYGSVNITTQKHQQYMEADVMETLPVAEEVEAMSQRFGNYQHGGKNLPQSSKPQIFLDKMSVATHQPQQAILSPQRNNNFLNFSQDMDDFDQVEQLVQQQNPQSDVILKLEELEKIYSLFHEKSQSFSESQLRKPYQPKRSIVPSMTVKSNFFKHYDDDLYDDLLENLRTEYELLCVEEQ